MRVLTQRVHIALPLPGNVSHEPALISGGHILSISDSGRVVREGVAQLGFRYVCAPCRRRSTAEKPAIEHSHHAHAHIALLGVRTEEVRLGMSMRRRVRAPRGAAKGNTAVYNKCAASPSLNRRRSMSTVPTVLRWIAFCGYMSVCAMPVQGAQACRRYFAFQPRRGFGNRFAWPSV